MLKFSKDSYVDVDLYESRLKRDGYIVIDTEKMRSIRDYMDNVTNSLAELARTIMSANSGNMYSRLSKDNIYNYLIGMEGVPERRIGTTPGGDISLDVNKYLKPLYEDGFAEEFLGIYIEWVATKTKNSLINGILSKCYERVSDKYEDRYLKKCEFTVTQKDNLRFFYKESNIVGISKIFNESIVPPPGYVLVSGDFAQSDFRIAYNLLLRNEENAKIMDEVEDKYEGMARILDKALGKPFDLEAFKESRDIFKVNILGPMYGKTYSRSQKSQSFIARMNAFLSTCDNYQKFKNSITNRMEMGLPLVIESYFGHTETIPILQGKKGFTDTLNKALNTPIQTGTSEIMILVVNSILDKFYSMGYTEDDVRIYYSRHDEPLFIIKEELMKDSWVFKNASEIIVDSWSPLNIDFTFHRRYGVYDEELEMQYKKSIMSNKDKIDVFERDKEFVPYTAIKQTELLGVYFDKVGDKSVICVYDDTEKRALFRLIHDTNEFHVFEQAKALVLSTCTDLFRADCNGALVRNRHLEQDIFHGGILYKFIKVDSSNEVATAKILCENMCLRLAKRDGYDYAPTVNLQSFADLIRGVKDWNER